MDFPERFSNLPPFVWPRLRALLDVHEPGGAPVDMTIGEPKHAFPAFVGDVLAQSLDGFGQYPVNEGRVELLDAIVDWVQRRYGVSLGTDRVLALNGTREGLYNACAALCPETKSGEVPVVLSPNPFYQTYSIAALSIGAEPVFVNATAETGHLPDYAALPTDVLDRTALCYICSPANPQGAVASRDYWRALIALAEKHDFRILADECYSEIYPDAPPPGVLEIAAEMGSDPERIVAFHSLSKRSNLPGLRSGFVASGPETIRHLRQLRAYGGSPLPMPLQAVAAKVWADEDHVVENRAIYAEKYALADRILGNAPGYQSPEAGFFLWIPVEDGEATTVKLWKETGVRVLPGAYLSRDTDSGNPGTGYIRVAMVAPTGEVERGLTALRDCLFT